MLNEQYTITGEVVAEFTAEDKQHQWWRVKVIHYADIDVYEVQEKSNCTPYKRSGYPDFETAIARATKALSQYNYKE